MPLVSDGEVEGKGERGGGRGSERAHERERERERRASGSADPLAKVPGAVVECACACRQEHSYLLLACVVGCCGPWLRRRTKVTSSMSRCTHTAGVSPFQQQPASAEEKKTEEETAAATSTGAAASAAMAAAAAASDKELESLLP